MHNIRILPLLHNTNKIPHNANTHYAYNVFPVMTPVPQTSAGAVRKPMIQRKGVKDARPLPTPKQTTKPGIATMVIEYRPAFRKDIDKEALAAYFDNDVLPSHVELKQENLAAMVAELEAADVQKAAAKAKDEEKLFKFVESVRLFAEDNLSTDEFPWTDQDSINAFVADRFVRKHKGADTAAAMRALEKSKRKMQNLDLELRQIQRMK